jgi:hypothetical protein
MDFLRRRLRGGAAPGGVPAEPDTAEAEAAADAAKAGEARASPVDEDAQERDYELDLLRQEQDRLDDLQQRQLRYANYAWEPPAQGGEPRADDEDRSGPT